MERGILLVKCFFIGGKIFPSFPEQEQCWLRPFFFFVVSTCRCKLQEASMCSFCELTAIFFIVNHN